MSELGVYINIEIKKSLTLFSSIIYFLWKRSKIVVVLGGLTVEEYQSELRAAVGSTIYHYLEYILHSSKMGHIILFDTSILKSK